MAEEQSQLISGAFAAYNSDGAQGFLNHLIERDALAPDFAMEIQRDAPNGGTWSGPDGFREMVDSWLEAWAEFEVRPQQPEEVDPGKFVIPTRQAAVARGSGLRIDADYFYTAEFAQGRIRRIGLFMDRGLAERYLRSGELS